MNKLQNKNIFSNYFFVFTKNELLFILTIFILGIILGATVITVITGKYIDQLVLKNKEMEILTKDQEKQLNQLDKQFKNKLLVQKITPLLDTDINKHTQQDIIKKIRSLLAGLVGKDISEIDPLLLRDIINEASIIVEDHIYQLHLSYLIVSDELKLYLIINNHQESNQDE